MGKFNELMQRKVMGVKVLYLTAVFVLVLVAFAWKMKPGVSEDEIVDVDETPGGDDEVPGDLPGTLTSEPDYSSQVGSGTVTTTPTDTTQEPVFPAPATPEDNSKWMRRGIEWLVSQGVPPDTATAALQKYLGGDQLSFEEGQIRDRVIRQFGLPPEIPVSGGTASKPTTPAPPAKVTPTAKPPLVHKVQGTADNTYGELAKKYYGSNADKYIDLIQAANTKLGHAAPTGGWKKGTNVFIPAKREPKYYTAKKGKTTKAQIAGANGISQASLTELNDNMKFPVKIGTKVRVA